MRSAELRRRRATSATEIAAIELNVSCPNVATGLDIGADPASCEALAARGAPAAARKPLIVKLTPEHRRCRPRAPRAAEAGGADAVSLINTLRAMALAPGRLGSRGSAAARGGLSGPAIRAVALAQVARVAARVGDSGRRHGRRASGARRPRAARRGCHARRGRAPRCFRDPAAGARIARELDARFHANCGDDVRTWSLTK